MWGRALLGCLILAFAPAYAADAQTPLDRYQRAERLLRSNLAPKVLNGMVVPHWLGTEDRFWYRHQTADGWDFIIMDPASGRKSPAFDHHALAAALAEASQTQIAPERLPIDDFAFVGGDVVAVQALGKAWRCDPAAAVCTERKTAAQRDGDLASPDGHWAVFTRNGNLWLRDLADGSERALTEGAEENFGWGIWFDGWKGQAIPRQRAGRMLPPFASWWAPDSSRVVISRVDQRHIAPYPYVNSAPPDHSFRPQAYSVRIPLAGEPPAIAEWFVFDIPGGHSRRINLPYDKLFGLQQDLMPIRMKTFGPDPRHFFVTAFGAEMMSATVFDIDLATGNTRTVLTEAAQPRMDMNSTSYNLPDVRITRDGKTLIWFSERSGWGHLYRYDMASGRLRNAITKGDWLVRDIVHVDEARGQIWFTGSGREPGDPYARYLYRANFDGTGLTLISTEAGDHLMAGPANDILNLDDATDTGAVSPSGRYVVYTSSPLAGPTVTIARATAHLDTPIPVETANVDAAIAEGYRPPELFSVKAADGVTDLWGVVYKPHDFDPSKHYPVIDAEYTSPLTTAVPHNYLQPLTSPLPCTTPAAFAELGFIVVTVDARGTTFRSKAFSQYGYGQLNLVGLDDHVAAIKRLAQRIPAMDLNHVGIIGGSYGGWGALRGMLEFPEFYKAGVACAPPASLQGLYVDYHFSDFQGPPLYKDGSHLRPGPADVPLNWQVADGPSQASRLAGKLMILMGELDENVPPGDTLQFVDALIKADKDFELVYLPGASHAINRLSSYTTRRIWDFLVRTLRNETPPEGFHLKASG